MSRQPSPGPSQQAFPAGAAPSAPPVRTKSKAYSSGIAAGAEDVKYAAKFKDLKRKVKEIESDNDKIYLKILQARRNIQRAQLERAILYERLSNVPASPPPHNTMLPEVAHDMHDVARGPLPPAHGDHYTEPRHTRHGSSHSIGRTTAPFNSDSIPRTEAGLVVPDSARRIIESSHPRVINGLTVISYNVGGSRGTMRIAVNELGAPLMYNSDYVTEEMLLAEQREIERHLREREAVDRRHHRRDREWVHGENNAQHLEAQRMPSRSRSQSSHPPPQALVPSVSAQGLSRRERESLREIERERERERERGERANARERERVDIDDRDHEIEWERERERQRLHREPGLGGRHHRDNHTRREEHIRDAHPRHHHHQDIPISGGGRGPSPVPEPMIVQERSSRRHDIHELAGSRPPSLGHSPIPAHSQAGAPNVPGAGIPSERHSQQPPTPVQTHMSPPAVHTHAHTHGHHQHSHPSPRHAHSHSHGYSHGHAHSHSSVSANSSRSPTESRQHAPGAVLSNTRIHGHQRVGPGANLNLSRDLDREREGIDVDAPQGDAEMADVDDEQWSGRGSPPPNAHGRVAAWDRGHGELAAGAPMREQYGGRPERSPSPGAAH